jgi:hypothetical protein
LGAIAAVLGTSAGFDVYEGAQLYRAGRVEPSVKRRLSLMLDSSAEAGEPSYGRVVKLKQRGIVEL